VILESFYLSTLHFMKYYLLSLGSATAPVEPQPVTQPAPVSLGANIFTREITVPELDMDFPSSSSFF
jgi:hypothetical protein